MQVITNNSNNNIVNNNNKTYSNSEINKSNIGNRVDYGEEY